MSGACSKGESNATRRQGRRFLRGKLAEINVSLKFHELFLDCDKEHRSATTVRRVHSLAEGRP